MKFILSPKDKGRVRCLRTIQHVCNNSDFCLAFKMFMVKRIFSRYFMKFLVTTPLAEMTKGHT